MSKNSVYLLLISGKAEEAEAFVTARYPGSDTVLLSRRTFHEAGPIRKLLELRKLRGRAVVLYFEELERTDRPRELGGTSLFHGCREIVFADSHGRVEAYSKRAVLRRIPDLALSAAADCAVVAAGWIGIRLLSLWPAKPVTKVPPDAAEDVAYLYPFPLAQATPGGEMSYLKGFLKGLSQEQAVVRVFTGCPLPVEEYELEVIPARRRFWLLRESLALSYNLRFAGVVWRRLRSHRPRVLYQRHGRFVVAGALLSRLLRVPLALEYQCSEYWRAANWDPGHFLRLIRLAEDFTISSSAFVVALSNVLKDELLARGVAEKKIILNPAAVDPERFRPGCGGGRVRAQWGFAADAVVVGFVGSFSYYHGITTLQKAMEALLRLRNESPAAARLRFLLVGDGLLRPEMQETVHSLEGGDAVVFTGTLPHELIPSYLDACDILVSPHAKMPGGQKFFGSPSKIFEYMAMGKAIVASRMDQLGEVLCHGETAWLVEPDSDAELCQAIERLAQDAGLRETLGRNVRRVALEQHTWQRNGARFLSALRQEPPPAPAGL
jgi:glycosyltransferase involved in cell wall biosynthesis